DGSTGVVTLAPGSMLDYETAPSDDITVLATSSDGSSNSATFTITVTDVNDNAPVITSSGTFSVAENATAVGTVTATDADGTAANNTVGYSIVARALGASALISITPTTRTLTSNVPHDYGAADSQRLLHLTFRPFPYTTLFRSTFTITVTDVNDNAPVITSSGTFSVAENATAVGTVTATDADGTAANNTVGYSIVA